MDSFDDSEIKNLAMDLVWALQSLGIEQAKALCKLVYQEAEFSRLFKQHQEEGVGPRTKVALRNITDLNNETFATFAILHGLTRVPMGDDEELPVREIVRIFLKSLAAQIAIGVEGEGV